MLTFYSYLIKKIELYVGGLFNNTIDNQFTGLNHVAVYSTSNNVWSALGKVSILMINLYIYTI